MEDHGLWKVIVPVEHRYGTDEAIELEIWFNSEEGEFAVSEWSDCMKKYSVMSMSDVFKKLGITAEDCQKAFEEGKTTDDN